eukprot:748047-Pleurochrysis_carterae.AAC.2
MTLEFFSLAPHPAPANLTSVEIEQDQTPLIVAFLLAKVSLHVLLLSRVSKWLVPTSSFALLLSPSQLTL